MTQALVLATALLALRAPAAQPPEAVVLKVHAAAAPKPALKYTLLPELRELKPGNAVLGYLTCFAEQHNFFRSKEATDEREKFDEMPLKDLAKLKLTGYGGIALTRADAAARLEHADWQVLGNIKSDGYGLLVPEVQQIRELAWALRVRFRTEVAGGRTDDALVTARTMLALARHLGEHPTLIAHLVGLAVAAQALDPLEELLQQKGCPNLYWALTDLPHPLIDARKGWQGERLLLEAELAQLDRQSPMSDGQLQKVLSRWEAVLGSIGTKGVKDGMRGWVTGMAKDEVYVEAARGRLAGFGLAKEAVKLFPALQVILLDEGLAYAAAQQDAMKAAALPYWQGEAILKEIPVKMKPTFGTAVNGIIKVREAQTRLEQRLALLRCVEALRLYAAEHGGKLPAKLADVPVPLPVDPMTGQTFDYQLDGATATLRGKSSPATPAVYKVSVAQ